MSSPPSIAAETAVSQANQVPTSLAEVRQTTCEPGRGRCTAPRFGLTQGRGSGTLEVADLRAQGGRHVYRSVALTIAARGGWFGRHALALPDQVDDGRGAERFRGHGARACWRSAVRSRRQGDREDRRRQEPAEMGKLLRVSRCLC